MDDIALPALLVARLKATADRTRLSVSDLIARLLDDDHPERPERGDIDVHVQLAVSAARLGIWALDVTTGRIDWNDELLTIYGMTRDEFESHTVAWEERVHPDDRDYANEKVAEAFAGQQVLDVRFRIVMPSGEVRYISGAATPIIRNGRVVKVVGNNLDITEMVRAQQTISDQTAILANISDAVIVTNPRFEVVSWNRAAEALYGYSAEEVVGQHIGRFVQTDYALGDEAIASTQLGTTGQWSGEVTQYHRSGTPIAISSSVTLIQRGEGMEPLVAAINRDISARKRAEQLELEQAAMRRSIQQEREKSAFRAKMLSTIAHEFRTPLAIIQSSTDLLVKYSDRISQARKEQSAQNITREMGYITKMLDDLSLIARSQRQALIIKRQPVAVEMFVQAVVDDMRQMLKPQQGLTLTTAPIDVAAMLDPHLMQIALGNLISNALKYSPDDGQVSAHVCRVGAELVIDVADRGMGIPEADLPQLFEPFFRAENVGETSGSGLGLSIVREVAQLHGGTVSCESVLGAGSTFSLRLPFLPAAAEVGGA
ncbi:MAG: PAS domain S-box protein [Anaerolineae bacterium]|nr:PAS domain S-box protein [Anaerolineae bacterium]